MKANGIDIGWPQCFICRKLVEEVATTRNVYTDNDVIIVRCHGQTETIEIPMVVVMENPLYAFSIDGYAFKPTLEPIA